ncbi:MAG: hypothetical protein A2V88_00915 [Elusimicrobia bacterium RBG_16_66_12]|nr:MAG: hypothetical protein A2V88_00915 [Elusimicrobia bacterium RBG_16_66_12]
MTGLEDLLHRLLHEFERRRTRYALMGGFALGALGAPRATRDLDFLIHRDDLAGIHDFLTAAGYKRIHHSAEVSQYSGDLPWGGIDFIHAFRPLALRMIEQAASMPSGRLGLDVRVVRPEDLIGLKIQALANDPARLHKEIADIEALLSVRSAVDWGRVKEYCDLFHQDALYADLEKRFRHV